MTHQIAPHMGVNASAVVREVMLACSMPSDHASDQAAAAMSVPTVVSIAEWYVATAIKDSRGLKVSISKARWVSFSGTA